MIGWIGLGVVVVALVGYALGLKLPLNENPPHGGLHQWFNW